MMSTKIGLSSCKTRERRFGQAILNPLTQKLNFAIMQIKGLSYYKAEPALHKVDEVEEKEYDEESDSLEEDQAYASRSVDPESRLDTTEYIEITEQNTESPI